MAEKDLPLGNALLTAVKNQQASLFLQFGGQASVWFAELEAAFKANSTAKTLVALCAGVITEELQVLHKIFPSLERHYHLGFDVLKWLTLKEPMPTAYRQSAPISYPMILLTQLANWAEALDKLKLSPRELCGFFQGATGHSQGVVAAVVVASSSTLRDYFQRSQDAIRYMFWHGVRVQEASGPISLDNSVSPMLLVKATVNDIEPIITQLNSSLEESQRAYISLRNSSSMTVVSGTIQTLIRFKTQMSSSKFECTFLPVTCPFHCPLLASAIPAITSDLNRLKCVFSAADLKIPVYDPADGVDLRTVKGGILNDYLVQGQTVKSVDWPAAIAVVQKGITHILDVGPGQKIMRLSGGITNGNAVMISVKDSLFYEKGTAIPRMTRLLSDSKDPDLLEQLRYGGYVAPAVAVDSDQTQGATPVFDSLSTPEAKRSPSVVIHTPAAAASQPAVVPEQSKHTITFKLQTAESNSFVFSHMIRGNLVIPMTVAVGKLASVTLEHYPGWYLSTIQDAVLYTGVQFRQGLGCEITLSRDAAAQQEEGKLLIVANFRTESTSGKLVPCYKASIGLTNTPPRTPPAVSVDLKEGKTLSKASIYDGRILFHGPLLQGIEKVLNVTDNSLVAECKHIPLKPNESGEFGGGFDSFTLDIALQAALVWARVNFDQASLPNKMTKLEFYSAIPANSKYYLTISVTPGTGPVRFLNCDYHDADGMLYLRGTGLSITMNPTLSFQLPPKTPTAAESKSSISARVESSVPAKIESKQVSTQPEAKKQEQTLPRPPVSRTHHNDARIAVVGMAVKYAGAPDTKQFWELLVANKDNIVSVPPGRLVTKNKELHLTTERSKYADSIVSDVYGLLDEEAKDEHSLLLLLARRALADTQGKRNLDRCGVVSGCLSFPRDTMQHELMPLYREHIERELTKNGEADLATSRSWGLDDPAPARTEDSDKQASLDPASYVAQELGLKGGAPTYVLDAACASALYALKLAQDHLVQGDADVMLCGASTFPEPFFILTGFSAFQALPLPGQFAAPFQAGTSGLTPGEGGAMMVLKRLEDAVRDGDRIYGTLLGVATTNAGKGLPLKPDASSELECLQTAYSSLGVEPSSIQYVECHATGTAQGDECEISAVRSCFNPHMPLIGSTKGTFGHSLVAAGFAGMCKLLLAMQNNLIPATHSPGSPSSPVCSEVVMKNQPWPKVPAGKARRGALSAFGFGGTNAHAVFEEFSHERFTAQKGKEFSPCKLAIVGMAARFGTLMDLNDVERAVYDGANAACALPEKRWRFLSDDKHFLAKLRKNNPERVHGCFIDSIEVDYKALKLSLLTEDELLPQQLVALSTIDLALKDCRGAINRNSKVAVLVGLGADMELYRHRARLAMRERMGLGSTEARSPSQEALLDYVADAGTSTSYTSNIGNIIATRIASMWGFTGPSFTVTEGANSVFRCVQLGRAMLSAGEVEAVVVAGVDLCGSAEALYTKVRHGQAMSSKQFPTASFDSEHDGFFVGEGAGVLILKRMQDCEGKNPADVRVYAVLEDVAEAATVAESAAQALAGAHVDPKQVDLLEVSGDSAPADDLELPELAGVYRAGQRSVSVGTVKANLGHCGYASGAAALIKTALCLHNQYLPSLPHWNGPKERSLWEKSAFYVCNDSKAWVKNAGIKRYAGVSGVSTTSPNSCFHMVLSDLHHETQNRIALAPLAPKLVLLRGSNGPSLISEIEASLARAQKDSTKEMVSLLRDTLEEKNSKLVLSLVSTVAGLPTELQKALAGVGRSVQSGTDWTSPSGSFFSPRPLGSDRVAFVYGDGASPYIGLGQQLHRIYPALHEVVHAKTTDMWSVSDEAWNCREISKEESDAKKLDFAVRQVDMFRSGVYHAVCFTSLARDLLGIKPKAAFGLSMGEVSMFFAFSEHNSRQSDKMMHGLATSSVWNNELAARFNALRKAWNVSSDAPSSAFWQGYVLHASRADIEAALPSFQHVRLLIVNDQRTCIIAGMRDECQALIAKLGVQASPLTQGMVAHCVEVRPYAKDIAEIHGMIETPSEKEVELFTSVGCKPLSAVKQPIGTVVSELYSEVADFPKLATAVYQAGYNVFVELGANDARSQALKMILSGQPHVSVAIDRKGHQTWKQLLKMLAVLLSHNTSNVNLTKLYHPILLTEEGHPPNPQAPPITRGKDPQTPRRSNSNNSQKILRMVPINGRFAGLRYPPTPYTPSAEEKEEEALAVSTGRTKLAAAVVATKAKVFRGVKSVNISTSSSLDEIQTALLAFDADIKVTSSSSFVSSSSSSSSEVFACTPTDLGDVSFYECYNTAYPLYIGAMAKGISSTDLVIACGEKKMLASFGSGGLPLETVKDALSKLQHALPHGPYAVNLLYNKNNEQEETVLIDMFLAHNVRVLEVSNYQKLTPQLIRYRVLGLEKSSSSSSSSGVICKNKIIFKVSHISVAELAMQPLPIDILTKLHEENLITKQQFLLGQQVSFADDIVIETDGGGYTDNRPSLVILPLLINARDRIRAQHTSNHTTTSFSSSSSSLSLSSSRVRIGVAGGMGCPESVCAAFALGASFVCTGTVNQMSKQAGVVDDVRLALSRATYTDVGVCPADLTSSTKLQVLKKGTMFIARARKLHDLYVRFSAIDQIPAPELAKIEKDLFKQSIDQVWEETKVHYTTRLRNPAKLQEAERDSRMKFELIYHWYLVKSFGWTLQGDARRKLDYHIWCSPAIGAFNSFIKGSYLDPTVGGGYPCVYELNLQLLLGACHLMRIRGLASAGVPIDNIVPYHPRKL